MCLQLWRFKLLLCIAAAACKTLFKLLHLSAPSFSELLVRLCVGPEHRCG